MIYSSNKLLSLMLICLLVLLPIKSVVAEVSINNNSPCHHHINDSQIDNIKLIECENCEDFNHCQQSHSSFIKTLNKTAPSFNDSRIAIKILDINQTTPFQTINVLFRPPKA